MAEVRQVKTMVDHSVNLTLNVPEDCLPQAQQFMAWLGELVRVVAVVEAKPDGAKRTKKY